MKDDITWLIYHTSDLKYEISSSYEIWVKTWELQYTQNPSPFYHFVTMIQKTPSKPMVFRSFADKILKT